MAQFTPGKDTTITAPEPQLDVLASQQTPLTTGKHVFQLVVTDDSGNQSDPATITIIVRDTVKPTAVIDFINADGGTVPTPTVEVPFGARFGLSGKRSSDIGGTVQSFIWQLMTP